MPRRSVRSRRRALGGFLSFLIGALAVAAVALICAIVLTNRYGPSVKEDPAQEDLTANGGRFVDMKNLPDSELVLKADSFSEDYLPGNPTPTPTPEPETPTPVPMATLSSSVNALGEAQPEAAKEGMLPVYSKAVTSSKIIAITLDECGSVKQMKSFINMADHFGAKLTLFPTGESLMKNDMGEVMKACVQRGFEIENRGYNTKTRIYQCSDSMLVQQVWKQSVALNYVLGVKYQPHFFRCYGGHGENDPRTHAFLKQQGYQGIAHWTVACTGMEVEKLVDKLVPGGIYTFRCTEADGQLMYSLMIAARDQGYQMVTMNQMFGLPENTRTQAQDSLLSEKMPVFEYDNVLYDLMPGDETWAVMLMQQRLMTLGYLPSKGADGIFGEDTSTAVRVFQANVGLLASGVGDVATQQALYSPDAPINHISLAELFPTRQPTAASALPGATGEKEESNLVPSEDFGG